MCVLFEGRLCLCFFLVHEGKPRSIVYLYPQERYEEAGQDPSKKDDITAWGCWYAAFDVEPLVPCLHFAFTHWVDLNLSPFFSNVCPTMSSYFDANQAVDDFLEIDTSQSSRSPFLPVSSPHCYCPPSPLLTTHSMPAAHVSPFSPALCRACL